MHCGADIHLCASDLETAMQGAGPKIQSLPDFRDVGQLGSFVALQQAESNLTKVQTMRILTQPIIKLALPFTAGRVPHRPTMGVICLLYTSDAADERSSVDLG